MKLNFNHIQAAHCENGVTSSLLKNIGVQQITEPLAFSSPQGLSQRTLQREKYQIGKDTNEA